MQLEAVFWGGLSIYPSIFRVHIAIEFLFCFLSFQFSFCALFHFSSIPSSSLSVQVPFLFISVALHSSFALKCIYFSIFRDDFGSLRFGNPGSFPFHCSPFPFLCVVRVHFTFPFPCGTLSPSYFISVSYPFHYSSEMFLLCSPVQFLPFIQVPFVIVSLSSSSFPVSFPIQLLFFLLQFCSIRGRRREVQSARNWSGGEKCERNVPEQWKT